MSRVFTQRISKGSCNFMEREYILVVGRQMTETMEREKAHTRPWGLFPSLLLPAFSLALLASAPSMLNNARVILFGRGPLLLLLDASLSTHPEKSGCLICIESRCTAPLLAAAASSPPNPPRPNVSRRRGRRSRHLLHPSERLSGMGPRR